MAAPSPCTSVMCTCGFYGYSIDNPDISLNGCNNFTITLAKEKIQNYKYPLTYAQTFQRQELLQVKQKKKKHDKWLLTAAIGSTNLNKKHLTSVWRVKTTTLNAWGLGEFKQQKVPFPCSIVMSANLIQETTSLCKLLLQSSKIFLQLLLRRWRTSYTSLLAAPVHINNNFRLPTASLYETVHKTRATAGLVYHDHIASPFRLKSNIKCKEAKITWKLWPLTHAGQTTLQTWGQLYVQH